MASSKSLCVFALLCCVSLGAALKCYQCSGYDSSRPESNFNNPYCTSANFKKSKVEKVKNLGDTCVKSIIYTGSFQWVDRYQTSVGSTQAKKRSAPGERFNASLWSSLLGGAAVAAYDGDANDATSMRLAKRYIPANPTNDLFYCNKNFCNAASLTKFSFWGLAFSLAVFVLCIRN